MVAKNKTFIEKFDVQILRISFHAFYFRLPATVYFIPDMYYP